MLALLAMSIFIRLVDIGNTAAIAMNEPCRESAILRVVGLNRLQLISMTCVEAALMAAVATVVEVILDAFFGWVDTHTLGALASEIPLAVQLPWAQTTGS